MTALVARAQVGKPMVERVPAPERVDARPPADDGWSEGDVRVAAYLLIVALSGFVLAVAGLLATILWMM
jgi:hypothetical protein